MKKILLIIVISICTLISCQKKNEDTQPQTNLMVQRVDNLAADPTTNTGTGQPQPATGKFTLFSLKDKAIIPNTDSTTNKWDIGFRGTTIIINGGTIRTGQGGAYIHTGLFDELKQIPDNQIFNTDQSTTQLAIPTGSGTGWYNYNPLQNWISPIAGRVLVIRTGDGKFAKLEILSYYRDAPNTPSTTAVSRYYTFRYIYQPNGTRTF
jgi:hypothetical protein